MTEQRNGLLKAVVQIPAHVTPAGYHAITVDPVETVFFDVTGAPIPALPGLPGGVITPEPAALSLLAPAALLALRRRRRRCHAS